MKIISNRRLREFSERFPEADMPLQAWRKVMEKSEFPHWGALKAVFPHADKVGDKVVFNIGGNKFRIAAGISFAAQILWIKAVMTHAEYDKGAWKT
ncbi:MAG: type II toxin-antitoxin system HigB family toxin [Zoogloeaceae bacterium]|jgi:mRNA interferase HigB|nr:type II toxin-antitoxin system HigB family toxin [Zoogloeaceae bacterium]